MQNRKPGRPVDRSKYTAIMKTAREILFEDGPMAVTMERVAAYAQVSKGTIYSYFANRKHLLKAVIEAESALITKTIDDDPETLNELADMLTGFVENLLAYLVSKEHLRLMQVIGLSAIEKDNFNTQVYMNGPQIIHSTLKTYLSLATKAGLICCEEPLQSAELLLGMVMGLDLVRAIYGIPLSQQKSAHSIVNSFLATLRKK